jgi:hypothetical protein
MQSQFIIEQYSVIPILLLFTTENSLNEIEIPFTIRCLPIYNKSLSLIWMNVIHNVFIDFINHMAILLQT